MWDPCPRAGRAKPCAARATERPGWFGPPDGWVDARRCTVDAVGARRRVPRRRRPWARARQAAGDGMRRAAAQRRRIPRAYVDRAPDPGRSRVPAPGPPRGRRRRVRGRASTSRRSTTCASASTSSAPPSWDPSRSHGRAVVLRFSFAAGSVEVSGRCRGTTPPALDELSRSICAAVVDEYELDVVGGARRFRLSKRSAA